MPKGNAGRHGEPQPIALFSGEDAKKRLFGWQDLCRGRGKTQMLYGRATSHNSWGTSLIRSRDYSKALCSLVWGGGGGGRGTASLISLTSTVPSLKLSTSEGAEINLGLLDEYLGRAVVFRTVYECKKQQERSVTVRNLHLPPRSHLRLSS